MGGWTLGIESTAHTLSFGLVDSEGIPYPACSDTVRPDKGGIHPREAADHHKDIAYSLFNTLLEKYQLSPTDIGTVAFSQGPGLGPCLRVGAALARGISSRLSVPLVGVNHCVAHIEIGRQQCGCNDPVLLYVSGGNTQVIAHLDGRYRVLGSAVSDRSTHLQWLANQNGKGKGVREVLAFLRRVLRARVFPYMGGGTDRACVAACFGFKPPRVPIRHECRARVREIRGAHHLGVLHLYVFPFPNPGTMFTAPT